MTDQALPGGRWCSPPTVAIGSVDRAAFYQLKSMMQGVLARGTARSIANLAPYVAGKTGTSDDENDAWFVGFTNDVTVAVWLGYDNSDGKRRTLGGGSTGGGVAVPIFEPVIQAVGLMSCPRPHSHRPRRRPSASSPANPSTATQAKRTTAVSPSVFAWMRRARSSTPSIVCFLARAHMLAATAKMMNLAAERKGRKVGKTTQRAPRASVARSRDAIGKSTLRPRGPTLRPP